MIFWLVQSTADHPDLARGAAPPGLLSSREQARLAELRTPKRRHDWLLGRWTAKQLVQRYVKQVAGEQVVLPAIEIVNDRDGVPAVELAATSRPATGSAAVAPSLSISHCEEYALCVLLASTGGSLARESQAGRMLPPANDAPAVGADIERIRPRARYFVTDYFTPAEVDLVDRTPAGLQDTIVTAIWSTKEAALKAVHLGLSVDTRRVDCQLAVTDAHERWQPLVVTYRPYPDGSGTVSSRRLFGWWRTLDVYVLTIVVTEEMRSLPEQMPAVA